MTNVIPFPDPTPMHDRYCGACSEPVHIPNHAAWPEQCPHCKTSPLCVVSSPAFKAKLIVPGKQPA